MDLVIIEDHGTSHEGLDDRIKNSERLHSKRIFYDFTTENLADTMEILKQSYPKQIKGRILTVNGSGDHMINFYNSDPKEIIGIDQSLIACLYSDLKIAALRNISYEEFLGFFSTGERPLNVEINTGLSYSQEVYRILRGELHPRTQEFFDEITSNLANLRYHLISKSKNVQCAVENNNYLLDSESYEFIKRKSPKSKLIADTVQHHLEASDEVYDIIHLSNIQGYIKRSKFNEIRNSAYKRLADEGILIEYSFYGKALFKQGQIIDEMWDYEEHRIENRYASWSGQDVVNIFKKI